MCSVTVTTRTHHMSVARQTAAPHRFTLNLVDESVRRARALSPQPEVGAERMGWGRSAPASAPLASSGGQHLRRKDVDSAPPEDDDPVACELLQHTVRGRPSDSGHAGDLLLRQWD